MREKFKFKNDWTDKRPNKESRSDINNNNENM